MFGKKKKKNGAADEAAPKKADKKRKKDDISAPTDDKKIKKRFSLKKILFILLFLGAIAVAGAVVYRIYFAKDENTYDKKDLKHVTLSDEIVKFTYDLLPELYDTILNFNNELILLNEEMERIKGIGDAYPDQIKITEKELKSWNKAKDSVLKDFSKIEQQLESLYVSYRIDEQQGLAQIRETKTELAQNARDSLIPAMELTKRLKNKPVENIPEGFIKGNIYKIKNKISNLFD